MRIVSLLPSATEMVCALGLTDDLVGITHECDYPESVKTKPVLIESCLGPDYHKMSPGEIDKRIRESLQKGEGTYRFKAGGLETAKPDVVLTQGLCDVCAVPHSFVVKEISRLKLDPILISLDPQDLSGIITDIRRVGEATGRIDEAGELCDRLEERIGEVAGRTREIAPESRPRVAIIEWTDPIFAAGHWVPEMVELAGGVDCLAPAGEPSQVVAWEKVRAAMPDVIILSPCGYDLLKAQSELPLLQKLPGWAELPAVKNGKVFVLDANATLSRSGPRIVDGLEAMAQIIRPDLFPTPSSHPLWVKA